MALEYARDVDQRMEAQQWRGCCDQFVQRRWITADGHLTHLVVSAYGSEDEVEVDIDEAAGTFSYRSPGMNSRTITRALADITVYVANVDAWLDDLTEFFQIENSRRARKRTVIEGHLWHLGDLRVAGSHQFAPICVGRQLDRCGQELGKCLLNSIRPGQGIVISTFDSGIDLPNGHQAVALDRLVIHAASGVTADTELLDRVLHGVCAEAENPNEYFDDATGALRLLHLGQPKVFKGIQKSVIRIFWKERFSTSLKWADVVAQTDCGKDPGSVFGRTWNQWLERVEYGRYRLRSCRTK